MFLGMVDVKHFRFVLGVSLHCMTVMVLDALDFPPPAKQVAPWGPTVPRHADVSLTYVLLRAPPWSGSAWASLRALSSHKTLCGRS